MSADVDRRSCPDGGTCHHDCPENARCWRVDNAAPLSGVLPDEKWPAEPTFPENPVRKAYEIRPAISLSFRGRIFVAGSAAEALAAYVRANGEKNEYVIRCLGEVTEA